MREEHGNRPARGAPALRSSFWRRYWPWLVMCLLAALALGCGYAGFRQHFAALGEHRSPLTLLYLTVQLFVLESGAVVQAVPWRLELARFLAPVVAAWALLQGLALLFRDELQALCVRRARGHVVVCGLGQRGMQLVRDFRAARERVAVVEGDGTNEDIGACEELGAAVVVGNAEDPALLAGVGADRARHVIAVCADDGTNVEIATSLRSLLPDQAAGSSPPIQCFVHMVDLRLCGLLKRHRMVTNTRDPFVLRMFSVYENAARLLWKEHALERDLAGPHDPRAPHLVVLGLGQMGESVLLQAARMAHLANGRKLVVTIVDREAGKRRSSLLQRYPNLEEVCDARFFEVDVESPSFIASLTDWMHQDGMVTTVAICFDDDANSLRCGLNIMDEVQDATVPVLVRMSRQGGLASLLQVGGQGALAERLHPFGAVSRSCSRQVLLGEELDAFARAIHEDYVARRREQGKYSEDDPALRPWEELDEDFRESNRHQADHIPVKLRAVRCCSGPPEAGREAVEAFTDEEVELLAAMEHTRWNAERFLAGWSYGPERDAANRRSPYLVPWDQLPDDIREYDRQAVREIPALLCLIDERVYRCPEP